MTENEVSHLIKQNKKLKKKILEQARVFKEERARLEAVRHSLTAALENEQAKNREVIEQFNNRIANLESQLRQLQTDRISIPRINTSQPRRPLQKRISFEELELEGKRLESETNRILAMCGSALPSSYENTVNRITYRAEEPTYSRGIGTAQMRTTNEPMKKTEISADEEEMILERNLSKEIGVLGKNPPMEGQQTKPGRSDSRSGSQFERSSESQQMPESDSEPKFTAQPKLENRKELRETNSTQANPEPEPEPEPVPVQAQPEKKPEQEPVLVQQEIVEQEHMEDNQSPQSDSSSSDVFAKDSMSQSSSNSPKPETGPTATQGQSDSSKSPGSKSSSAHVSDVNVEEESENSLFFDFN